MTADPARRVCRMPDDLANQIAAGEVVERPASAVKELVENAIDAGARRVRVDLEDGGLGLIRVADDGIGMTPEDALLCVERHATSKLRTRDDLFDIRTLGFRGEALPSIASVSRFELTTKPHNTLGGTRIRIEGGQAPQVSAAGCPPGTEIVVRDLFFNTPARLKFLRQRNTELRHAVEVIHRIALPRPDVGFVLTHNGRTLLELPAVAAPIERVRALFDTSEAGYIFALDPAQQDGAFCSGFFGQPALTRRTADSVMAFVNGRFVRDKAIGQAVRLAYEGMVDRGRHPVAIVFVDLPAHAVDVNVHPMKIEVRFHDANAVFRAVRRAVAQSLAQTPWTRGAAPTTPSLPSPTAPPLSSGVAAPEQAALPVRSYTLHAAPRMGPGTPGEAAAITPARPSSTRLSTPALRASPAPEPAEGAPSAGSGFFTSLHFVGTILGTYLLASDGEGLVVIDQHAAHERITYEQLRAAWASRRASAQPMLIPQVVRMDSLRAAALEDSLEVFAQLGFEIEPFGGTDFAVKSVPTILGRARVEPLLRDALDEIGANGFSGRVDQAIDAVLVRMACHGSIRAGQTLTRDEVHALFEQLDRVDFGGNCPHGRPVYFRMSQADLEKRFDRR